MKPTGERNSAKPKAREGRASGRERVQAQKKIARGKRSETSAALGLRSPNITSPERAAELSPIAMRPGILPAIAKKFALCLFLSRRRQFSASWWSA